MSDITAHVLVMFFRMLMLLGVTSGAVYLAYYDKPGWGWLIFLSVCVACGKYRLNNHD